MLQVLLDIFVTFNISCELKLLDMHLYLFLSVDPKMPNALFTKF